MEEVYRSLHESSWYSFEFGAGAGICVEASVKMGRKPQNDDAVLAGRPFPEVPVVFVGGEAMCPSKAKSQVRQFLAVQCYGDLEECLAAAPEEVTSIKVLAFDLDGEADGESAELMGGTNLGCRGSIRGDYGYCVRRARWFGSLLPPR